jgi:hypothetical protein
MTNRTFYDAIDVDNLPPDGDGYLGYDDGNWPDADAIAAKFPGKEIIRITVNPAHNKGIIGDGPPDNGTWAQWVQWVKNRRDAGVDPWINTNQSTWIAGQAAFNNAGVPQPHWWIAKYDNDPTIPAGALMKQYASNDDFDTSSAVAYLPGIDPVPTSTQTDTATNEEDDMSSYQTTSNPATGRAGLGFASGVCTTFQVTCDKGRIPAGGTWRFVAVLDTGPLVIADSVTAPEGKAVVHMPAGYEASGIIVYGPTIEFELYAQ